MSTLRSQEARERLLKELPPGRSELCRTELALGRILGEDLYAELEMPARPLSIMDGYALGASHRGPYRIVGESAAGHPFTGVLDEDQACRISTGAVVPSGAQAVLVQEEAQIERDQLLASEDAETSPGSWIRARGSELARQARYLRAGQRLGPAELALIRAQEVDIVSVRSLPTVAVLSCGDELVQGPAAPHQVRSTNAQMLAQMIADEGARARLFPELPDDPAQIQKTLGEALQSCDLVVSTGGLSVGDHDHLWPSALALGGRPLFRKLALRPGRPTSAMRFEDTTSRHALLVALPGNPASSFVAFELLVAPVLAAMRGEPGAWEMRWHRRRSTKALEALRSRELWLRALSGAESTFEPLSEQGSGALSSLAGAELLVELPPASEPYPSGTEFRARWIQRTLHQPLGEEPEP